MTQPKGRRRADAHREKRRSGVFGFGPLACRNAVGVYFIFARLRIDNQKLAPVIPFDTRPYLLLIPSLPPPRDFSAALNCLSHRYHLRVSCLSASTLSIA